MRQPRPLKHRQRRIEHRLHPRQRCDFVIARIRLHQHIGPPIGARPRDAVPRVLHKPPPVRGHDRIATDKPIRDQLRNDHFSPCGGDFAPHAQDRRAKISPVGIAPSRVAEGVLHRALDRPTLPDKA
jgi:hypothetical protein